MDNIVLASAAKSAATTATVQTPSFPTAAVLVPVTKPLTVTVTFASPVPVRANPASFSELLIRLSTDTAPTVGASGAFVSTVITSETAVAPRFPATSV